MAWRVLCRRILSFLPAHTLLKDIAPLHTRMHNAVHNDDMLWRDLCAHDFGLDNCIDWLGKLGHPTHVCPDTILVRLTMHVI